MRKNAIKILTELKRKKVKCKVIDVSYNDYAIPLITAYKRLTPKLYLDDYT